jgi:hypothetical protein
LTGHGETVEPSGALHPAIFEQPAARGPFLNRLPENLRQASGNSESSYSFMPYINAEEEYHERKG